MSGSATAVKDEHPYVSYCKDGLSNALQDPLFDAPHLRDFLKYLEESSSQWPLGPYTNDPPFAWLYSCTASGDLQLSPKSRSRDFDPALQAPEENENPDLVFLSGHPSPGWLNAIGHKYNVDMHFFHQHLSSIRPSIHVVVFDEPSLPSDSRDILKLSIPTIGYLDDTGKMFGDISGTRSLLRQSLRKQVLKNVHDHPVGRPIIRNIYLHDRERFTLLQEVSMCVLKKENAELVLIWTDAGGEDNDPDLASLFEAASQGPDIVPKLCPTIFNRQKKSNKATSTSSISFNPQFKATQVFNNLHEVYGKTLNPESVRLSPFYAVSEVYAFAAAAENQFLNMMTKILENRMEDIMREGIQGTTSTQNTLPERINIQYDRSVLDAHSNRIRNILAFLRVADDPVWFPPLKDSASDEVAEVQRSLIHDFQHLQTQVVQLIQRCERAMELIAHNASLSEAKRSNLQSEGLQKLTRLTTVVTLLYVPLSFVCSFFGMNFSAFGQGELGLWIWAVVSVPVLLVSLFFLKRRLSNSSTMERSSKKWYQWMKIRG